MQLVISNDICDYFASKPLPQTNVFLEFDMTTLNSDEEKNFTEKDYELQVPCNIITLDLIRSGDSRQLNCCLDLEISDGFERISIERPEMEKFGSTFSTYEVNDFIKGFKDKLIKGKSIWEICAKK